MLSHSEEDCFIGRLVRNWLLFAGTTVYIERMRGEVVRNGKTKL